ncbi:hypothetical protein [Arthrobacter rhombi]|uniref:hypothetical protein n=1 Tax=Arthrobacter rhombi TaxID=71253 RepID=UPI003FCFB55A
MSPTNSSPDSPFSPLKYRLKKVLAPIARQAMPAVKRLAADPALPVAPKPLNDGFIRGYRALEREFPEADSPGNGKGETPPTKEAIQLKVQAARQAKAGAGRIEQLARGASLDASLLSGVRQLVKEGDRHKAIAVGHSLREQPATRNLGSAVLGVALLGTSGPRNSWSVFADIVNTAVSEAAADELYEAAFGTLGANAAKYLDADIAAGRIQNWSATALLHIAQKSLARGLNDQARTLIEIAQQLPDSDKTKRVDHELDRLATWLPEGIRRAKIGEVSGAINFGIMGYEQPDVTSRNIGDYIQTVASMGHLVRQNNFVFEGNPELVKVANELRATVKTERKIDGPTAKLNLLELNRDGNPYQALPEKTWALTFGWYMHDTFKQGYGIPFHENLRPILMSIYVRHPAMLTPDAIEYLRKYAPVGCRDWQSVALLRTVGVPAFFSGCLTTTVDTVFCRDGEDTRDATIFVDAPQTGPGDARTQAQTGIRSLSFADNIRLARDWVSHYHLEYNTVVTSRLHCFLPARSVGSKVTFLPKNRSDNRFGGLIDTNDQAFERIRQGILEKASTMLQAVASGLPENEIYALWRKICAPAMAEADAYLAAAKLPELEAGSTREILLSPSGDSSVHAPDEINVVIDVRGGEGKHLLPLVKSILANSSQPIHLWITADLVSAAERNSLESQGIPAEITWVEADATALKSLGFSSAAVQHEAVLALTFEALNGVEKAVFLPAAGLVRSNLATLSDMAPTTGNLVTARADQHRGRDGGLEMFRRVAARQGEDNSKALELIFASHRQAGQEFTTFDPNVMVVDMAAARQERFSERLVPLIQEYNMTFREGINALVGARSQELERRWNHAPGYEEQTSPRLVNWRDTAKPWGHIFTPFAAEFASYKS